MSLPSFDERIHLLRSASVAMALRDSLGNISEAARILGVSRPRMYRLMEESGINEKQTDESVSLRICALEALVREMKEEKGYRYGLYVS